MNDHYFSKSPVSKINLYTIKTNLKNQMFQFTTSSGVFSPKQVDKGTRLLIENMEMPNEGMVLDFGTGYGPIGIVAAAISPKCTIYMIDQNERAVWLAKENVKKNAINNAKVMIGGLEAVNDLKFKLILSNPPLSMGYEKINSIFSEISEHIDADGSFQFVLRKTHKKIILQTETFFSSVEVMKKKAGYVMLKCKIE
jgi:16S rRNA (guanine1207-N2)-methyltransferase